MPWPVRLGSADSSGGGGRFCYGTALQAPATLQLLGLFWHLARLSLRASGSSPQHSPTPHTRDSEALRRPQPRPLQVARAGCRGIKNIFNLHQSLADMEQPSEVLV
ncbi:unnamed protein product [Rangifer tarandus platyrhynchus]|uniref:Uncharacterized protein n=2 Tax=Rangifer tarandus platyrhynchus TaxID=3082113 RepID=A0ABN8Z173_RANTA|nr:unnamed protein product [Rangifer tarandus platyrhynchus]